MIDSVAPLSDNTPKETAMIQIRNSNENHYAWKGDDARVDTARARARRNFCITTCALCGSAATDRHHIDSNTKNNTIENILPVCRKCHMTIDQRLEKFISFPKKKKAPIPCDNCKEPHTGLRKGLCHRCNEYYRRNGKQRPNFAKESRIITNVMSDTIKMMRDKGLSFRKIASIMGISATTVRMFITKTSQSCHKTCHEVGTP
jgi:hypothetical protein